MTGEHVVKIVKDKAVWSYAARDSQKVKPVLGCYAASFKYNSTPGGRVLVIPQARINKDDPTPLGRNTLEGEVRAGEAMMMAMPAMDRCAPSRLTKREPTSNHLVECLEAIALLK